MRTIASAIESTAKGATGPEEAVETTNGAGDDTGNSSERRAADKLLVERGGLGIMYNQNKKPSKSKGTMYQCNTTAARKPWSVTGEIQLGCFWLWVVLPQLGTTTLGPPKTHAIKSANTERSSYDHV